MYFNLKRLNNKKGMSLVEIIVSLTVLGLISVPITMTFMNTMFTTRMTLEQLKLTAVERIVKENVADSIKYDRKDVFGNISDDAPVFLNKTLRNGTAFYDRLGLKVNDHNGKEYPDYSFDAVFKGQTCINTYKYLITLKKNEGMPDETIRKFYIEANILKENTLP